MSEVRRLQAVVTGRVQGVGFRYFVAWRARGLDLVGWVRNQANGSVEVEAEGDDASLQKLLVALKQGPPTAWVQAVSVQWHAPEHNFKEFSVGPSGY